MSTSQHTCQIAHNALGCYVSVGLEDPEAPHQFPLQPPNPPTAPTPIEPNTFVHILDSPTLSPSPFQFLPQEVSCQGMSKTWSIHDIWVPAELQRIYKGSLKGNRSLLNA